MQRPVLGIGRKQQGRDDVSCVVHADGCTHNVGMCHATAKHQLHRNSRTVFSMRPILRCYTQSQLLNYAHMKMGSKTSTTELRVVEGLEGV
jgi:hypothetical protein